MKIIKSSFLLIILTAVAAQLNAQEKLTEKLKFYGFIRNEFYHDTYKGVDAAMDEYYLFPLYTGVDANGEAYNEQGSSHLTAIATRMGVNINGPEILGAKSMGNIEVDFAGLTGSESVLIRIRKAFFKLNWENSSLLIGQTWHPFWGGACFPTVGALNTGAPFQPFNRSPQVNYTYKLGKLAVSGTALYENQYVSKGFYSSSSTTNSKTLPKRNAGIPEMVLSGNYYGESITLGAAVQYNTIQPIDQTTGSNGNTYITNELNTSYATMAYIQYKKDKLKVLAKTVYGQNLANLTMLGGYGVKSINESTGAYTYTNYNHSASLFNIAYGKKYEVGLFAGYTVNLGTCDALDSSTGSAITAGLLTKIQNLVRVAPHFAYNVKQFRFIAEYEMTSANYGSGNFDYTNGLYSTTTNATNHRLNLVMMFMF